MNQKTLWMLIIILFFGVHFGLAQEAPQVQIQKFEERTEATVKSAQAEKGKKSSTKGIWKPFVFGEGILVGIAQISSKAVGKVMDTTVHIVQTGSGYVGTPVFQTLDAKRWGVKKE